MLSLCLCSVSSVRGAQAVICCSTTHNTEATLWKSRWVNPQACTVQSNRPANLGDTGAPWHACKSPNNLEDSLAGGEHPRHYCSRWLPQTQMRSAPSSRRAGPFHPHPRAQSLKVDMLIPLSNHLAGLGIVDPVQSTSTVSSGLHRLIRPNANVKSNRHHLEPDYGAFCGAAGVSAQLEWAARVD